MFARDYRKLAWSQLSGNWGYAILAMLLYSIIVGALSSTFGVGMLILGGVFGVGLASTMLSFVRSGNLRIEELFSGFSDHLADRMVAGLLVQLYTALWSLLFIIPGIVKGYSYSMTYYILKDHPEMSATQAIDRSREIMNGNKWRLFCLHFSFIGWLILCSLTFGILTLWVMPYMQVAEANFYESIKGEPTPAAFTDNSDGSQSTGGTQAL